jgi:rhodanese-related sulfurtransferase
VDSREAVDYASGHIPRSLNFPLGDSGGELLRREDGTFAIWVGTILAANKPILVVAHPGKEDETSLRIARIGYQNVLGVLQGGFSAWKDANYPVEESPLIMVGTLVPLMFCASCVLCVFVLCVLCVVCVLCALCGLCVLCALCVLFFLCILCILYVLCFVRLV